MCCLRRQLTAVLPCCRSEQSESDSARSSGLVVGVALVLCGRVLVLLVLAAQGGDKGEEL